MAIGCTQPCSVLGFRHCQRQLEDREVSELTFTVKGMVCSGCSDTVQRVVTALGPVSDAVVNHETGDATVTHDGNVDVDAVYAAIRDAGFGVCACVDCKCDPCNCS